MQKLAGLEDREELGLVHHSLKLMLRKQVVAQRNVPLEELQLIRLKLLEALPPGLGNGMSGLRGNFLLEEHSFAGLEV